MSVPRPGVPESRISHVKWAIALDSSYSFLKGLLTETELHRILNILLQLSFDISNPLIRIKDAQSPILRGLSDFQEHLGGVLTITLLSSVGTGKEVHEMDQQLLIEASTYVADFIKNKSILNSRN